MEDKQKIAEEIAAEKKYPGAAIDHADEERVKEDLVKERTDVLDSNPRDNDL